MTSFAWNASNEACFCNFCNNNIVSIIYGANSGGIISCRSSHFCFVYKASNKAFASYRVIFKGKNVSENIIRTSTIYYLHLEHSSIRKGIMCVCVRAYMFMQKGLYNYACFVLSDFFV